MAISIGEMLNFGSVTEDSRMQLVAAAGPAVKPHFSLFYAIGLQMVAKRASLESPE